MQAIDRLFGESPFEHLVEHARKIHGCVALVRPIAEAIIACDAEKLRLLQEQMSKMEYEADLLKDEIRQKLPHRYFLPVNRDDMVGFLRQLDRIGDDAEDFAVVATFRRIEMPADYRPDFLALVDKVVQASESLLNLAEHLAQLQKEAFTGPDAEAVLAKIHQVCLMEWESDVLSRNFARKYYGDAKADAVNLIILEKLCRSLCAIADHAENVGKNLRLMILRK